MAPKDEFDVQAAFEAALRGDHARAHEALHRPGLEPGWGLALRSVLPELAGVPYPSLEELAAVPESSPGLPEALIQTARWAFARHDDATIAGCEEQLSAGHPTSPALRLLTAQRAWLGGHGSDDSLLAEAEAQAAESDLAATVVELAAMRSLTSADAEQARRHARRAVRMSRTEELPLQQYIAGIALARVRRIDGQTHMALRILAALQRVAPSPFGVWLEHELRMAGDVAAWGGAGPRLERAKALVLEAPSVVLQQDLQTLVSLLDPSAANQANDWRSGRSQEVPRGLLSIQTSTEGHHALVLFDPLSAVRVLASAPVIDAYEVLSSARPGRLETALCVLGLAPSPLSTEEFFSEVYGFQFEAVLHRGALEVVVHRIRDMVGDRAEIRRDLGTLSMVVHRPFAVPDPRVQASFDDAVLRCLAQHPDATARQSAERVGAPLRSVQHALKRLVQDGVCEASKRGRVICYRIEDTTFTEPTQVLEWSRP